MIENVQGEVVRFPQSRVRPPGPREPPRFLGYSIFARQFGVPNR